MVNDADGTDGIDDLAYATDHDRSILTPSDREFLLDRKADCTNHSKKQRRNRIRQRLRNAILDFTILFESLEDHDRGTVFNPDTADCEAYTRSITDVLTSLHLGAMGYYTPFKDMFVEGVNKAEQELTDFDYRMVTVSSNVEPVGQVDAGTIIDKLGCSASDQLTDGGSRTFVRLLAESDDFSATDLHTDIKTQMFESIERIDAVNERCNRRVDDLND